MTSQHGRRPPNPQRVPKSHGKKPPAPKPHRNSGSSSKPGPALVIFGVALWAVPVGVFAVLAAMVWL